MNSRRNVVLILLLSLALAGFAVGSVPAPGSEKGYYYVTSSPKGGNIIFDGTFYGPAPVAVPVSTTGSPGHTLTVSMTGYQTYSQFIPGNPATGQTIPVQATLVPIVTTTTIPPGGEKGYYSITSGPSGASVIFDGTNWGMTPVIVSVSTTGTPGHTIQLSMPGYQSWNQYYPGNPSSGETISVYAQLVPQAQGGKIYVTSTPAGASAVLDGGQDQLTTPGTFQGVGTGYHNVRVSLSGYQPYSTDVQVYLGGTANVYANLIPRQQIGSLSVGSTPLGAGLYVDGIYQGETAQIVGGLAPGLHTVTLKLAGYQSWSNTYTVNAGQTTYVNIMLIPVSKPTTGDMLASSTPPGAAVYLDGNYQGITPQSGGPLDVTGIAPGQHTVLLKKEGYQDYTATVQITPGQAVQVSPALQPESQQQQTTSASIDSVPSGADVYVNGQYLGITPMASQTAPVGTYNVTVMMPGYQPYSTIVTLTPGQAVQIHAALAPVATQTQATRTGLSGLAVLGGVAAAITGYAVRRRI